MKARFWKSIGVFLTILLLLFTLVTSLVPFLHPEKFPWLQLVPVLDPAFFVLALFLVLAASVFWKKNWKFYLPPLMFVFLFISRNPGTTKFTGHPRQAGLSVITYNVKQFRNDTSVVAGIVEKIKAAGADFVCLQEFGLYYKWPEAQGVISDFAQRTGYEYYSFERHRDNIFGIAFLSKYPIMDVDTVFMEAGPTNAGAIYTIEAPGGLMNVANVHLQSFNLQMDGVMEAGTVIQEQSRQARLVLGKLQNGTPAIITGDFNAVRGSAILGEFEAGFQNAFDVQGSGLGMTTRFLYPVGIDHVFCSQELVPAHAEILDWQFSDHRPIFTRFNRR